MALKTSSRILKLMRCLTGSQSSSYSNGVCDSSVVRDKLVLLRYLKRAEPYSGEKLASHIEDYYINLRAR